MSIISKDKITDLYKKALFFYDSIDTKEKAVEKENAIRFAKDFIKYNSVGLSLCYLFDLRSKKVVLMEGHCEHMLGKPASAYVGKSFFVILKFLKIADIFYFIKSAHSIYDYLYSKSPEARMKVKGSMYYNIKNAKKESRTFLHQAKIAMMDDKNNITYTIHILTDISHIMPSTSFKTFILDESEEESKMIPIKISDSNLLIEPMLTKSEKKILNMVSDGLTSRQIAYELNLSEHTVNNHKKNILKKTNSKSITEVIARMAIETQEINA